MKKTLKFVPYRRKLSRRTDYKKRLKLLMSGTPRLVVRMTNKNMIVQLVQYSEDGDKVIVTANSSELKKQGWNHATGNIPSAYLTGLLAGKKALAKKQSAAIVDLGLQISSKGSRIYAAVKGAIDAGLDIPCSEDALPAEDRLKGKHIADYKTERKTDASSIATDFDAVKDKIIRGQNAQTK